MNPHSMPCLAGRARRALACGLMLCLGAASAQAQPHPGRDRDGDGRRDAPHQRVDGTRWYDGAHGNNRYYPRPGWVVSAPPVHSRLVIWGGVNYRYFDSVWYGPGPRGYVVVRPPFGAVILDRPAFFSLVTIGAVAYLYANGVYYREHSGGGYEVVPPPVEGAATLPPTKAYVYPGQAQSAQQQATDEYDCHKWAVAQTGYDPTGAATGQRALASPQQRDGYQRASHACLEGRGYTVR
jgi:hypothetical protein